MPTIGGMMNNQIKGSAAQFDSDDHRIARRHKTFEPTTLKSDAGVARAHLLNVSATGALVHVNDPPKRGASVSIDLGDSRVDARVMWTNGKKIGLAFGARLTDAAISLLLRA